MYKKIAFFYPAENIGGAQLLFARVGECLFKNGFEIINADFGSSFISNFFIESNVKFEHVVIDKNITNKNDSPKDCIFIVSLSSINLINDYFTFSRDVKFVFWDVHPNNLLEHTYFSFFYKKSLTNKIKLIFKTVERSRIKKLGGFLKIASVKKGLYFMCYRNFMTNSSFFNIDISPVYMPICQPVNHFLEPFNHYKFKGELNVGWLSRIEDDKVDILNLLIIDLESLSRKLGDIKITLHVIGEGSASNHILTANNITIIESGKLYQKTLSEYLIKNIDVAFSMGTAALEFAARSIPTLLVPSSTLHAEYKEIAQRYIWLFEVEGYDVAAELYHSRYTQNIFEVLAKIEGSGLRVLGEASFRYVCTNHSIDEIAKALIDELAFCELSYNDISNSGIYTSRFLDASLSSLKKLAKRSLNR